MQLKVIFYKAYFFILWIKATQLVSTSNRLRGKATVQGSNQMLPVDDISLFKCRKLKSRPEHF